MITTVTTTLASARSGGENSIEWNELWMQDVSVAGLPPVAMTLETFPSASTFATAFTVPPDAGSSCAALTAHARNRQRFLATTASALGTADPAATVALAVRGGGGTAAVPTPTRLVRTGEAPPATFTVGLGFSLTSPSGSSGAVDPAGRALLATCAELAQGGALETTVALTLTEGARAATERALSAPEAAGDTEVAGSARAAGAGCRQPNAASAATVGNATWRTSAARIGRASRASRAARGDAAAGGGRLREGAMVSWRISLAPSCRRRAGAQPRAPFGEFGSGPGTRSFAENCCAASA